MTHALAFAMRSVTIAAMLGAVAILILMTAFPAGAATLKPRVTVSGPFVTLGDLVDGAGDAATTPVFRSPDPGTVGEVDARIVADLASGNGIENVQSLGLDRIVVGRSSRVVTAEEVRATLAAQLAARMPGTDADRLSLRFDEPLADLHVEEENAAALRLAAVDLHREASRFSAVLTIPGSRVLAAGRRVSGTVTVMVPVVTMGRRVERGATIAAADLNVILVPGNETRAEGFAALADVVGKAARRSLPEGAMPSRSDLSEPLLVTRNSPVTIVYRRGALTLTARGKALADAPKGTVIRVLNDYTHRIVEAEVTAGSTVQLLTAPTTVATLAAN
ncbi:MAG: flagellar basal body P-ring formation chaperone FlgA [Flavobacteriaceae bacterium]